jgi:hypothetical protein
MSPTKEQWKNWDQYEQTLFQDLQSTGDALDIEKATKSLFKDLQSISGTYSVSSGGQSDTSIEKAAREFAEEVQNQIKVWDTRNFGDQPKLADGPKTGSAPQGGPAPVTIDDTPWTKGPSQGGAPGQNVPAGSVLDAEQVKRTQKALAKGLPALANGIRDAVKGFEKGDPFAGSAAVMDICATLASTVGSMTAAGGPPGALIGALFSLMSTVLKAFMKPQTSLLDEIEGVVRTVEAETQQHGLDSAQGAVKSLISTMTAPGIKWKLSEIERKFDNIDGNAINTIRTSAAWLETSTNQDLKLWGPILAQQCQTYTMIMQILAIASANVDVSKDADKGANTYGKLAAIFTSNDDDQLRFLRSIRDVAQARGTVWHIGVFDSAGEYPDSGNLFFTDSLNRAQKDDWETLKGEQRAFAVSRTQIQNAADPNPYLAVFALEKADTQRSVPGPAYRHRRNARTYGLFGKWPLKTHSGWRKVVDLEGLTDICATPGEELKTVYVYTTDGGKEIKRYIHGQRPLGPDDVKLVLSKTFAVNHNCTVDTVAAVSEPETVAGEEPEVLSAEKSVVYGAGTNALRSRYIHAFFSSGMDGEVKTPTGLDSSITGMKADNKRLWVFTRARIFCATHSAIKDFLRRARRTAAGQWSTLPGPRWALYQVPSELGGTWQTEGRYDGLHEIAPCDDGTLWAVFTDKRGSNNMFYATPNFDNPAVIAISGSYKDASGHDVATNGWTKIPAQANRIQKHPIFCWHIVAELIRTLEKPQAQARTAGV